MKKFLYFQYLAGGQHRWRYLSCNFVEEWMQQLFSTCLHYALSFIQIMKDAQKYDSTDSNWIDSLAKKSSWKGFDLGSSDLRMTMQNSWRIISKDWMNYIGSQWTNLRSGKVCQIQFNLSNLAQLRSFLKSLVVQCIR